MLTGYCAGWSLKQLIQEGLGGIPGKITSAPAKHLATLCNQMVNFLGIMQNEWAGAQAFSSFDTYLAPFVKADNLSYRAGQKVHRILHLRREHAVAVGVRRRRSPTSRSTGRCRTTWPNCPQSSAARRWISTTRTA